MADAATFENVWKKREVGLEVARAVSRPVSHDDLVYLSNHIYPFIQLVNTNPTYSGEMNVKFITASTGWVIHDYGDAISTSIPHDLKKATKTGNAKDDEGKGGEGGEGGGAGTASVGQQVRTSEEIAALVKEKGWPAVEFIAGTQAMQRYLWAAAEEKNIKVEGFKPSETDKKYAERVRKMKQAKAKAAAVAPEAPVLE